MIPEGIREVALLNELHDVTDFDCGIDQLNVWLIRRGLSNQHADASRTFVALGDNNRVAGYYCLAASGLAHSVASGSLRRNMPDPIPVIVLGRLAIDRRFQNLGLGRYLLGHAMLNAYHASRLAAAKVLIVHAINDDAVNFYLRYGFTRVEAEPMTLVLPFASISGVQLINE